MTSPSPAEIALLEEVRRLRAAKSTDVSCSDVCCCWADLLCKDGCKCFGFLLWISWIVCTLGLMVAVYTTLGQGNMTRAVGVILEMALVLGSATTYWIVTRCVTCCMDMAKDAKLKKLH